MKEFTIINKEDNSKGNLRCGAQCIYVEVLGWEDNSSEKFKHQTKNDLTLFIDSKQFW